MVMTNNLFDEGGNSHDYDDRRRTRIGSTLGVSVQQLERRPQREPVRYDGSYVKLREVTLTYPIPSRFTQRLLPGSRDAPSFSGRNLKPGRSELRPQK